MGSLPPTGDVFVLGAGFSQAIAQALPTLAELGQAVVQVLAREQQEDKELGRVVLSGSAAREITHGLVPTGDLERWLSYLADPPPFLDEPERYFNLGLFSHVARVVVREIESRQRQALAATMPPWLARLVRLWHETQATVISLNYDGLVERALQHLDIPGSKGHLADAALGDLPGFAPAAAALARDPEPPTFRLIKLHGSIDWAWSPGDATGSTIVRARLTSNWSNDEEADVSVSAPGKEPFVVPPLATKSRYYGNSLVRAVWHKARVALASATSVTLCGYSLPASDFATAVLVSAETNRAARWSIADLEPRPIEERLARLGIEGVGTFAGASALEQVVVHHEERAARRFAHSALGRLGAAIEGAGERPDTPVCVRVSRSLVAPAQHLYFDRDGPDRTLVVECGDLVGKEQIADGRDDEAPGVRQLMDLLTSHMREQGAECTRLVAALPADANGRAHDRRAIVNMTTTWLGVVRGGTWLVLEAPWYPSDV